MGNRWVAVFDGYIVGYIILNGVYRLAIYWFGLCRINLGCIYGCSIAALLRCMKASLYLTHPVTASM